MKQKLTLLGIWVVCLAAGIVSIVWMLIAIFSGSPRAWTIALGFDRTGNAAFGGSDGEYLSARANRARLEGRRWGCVLCKVLDAIKDNHCESFNPPVPPVDTNSA